MKIIDWIYNISLYSAGWFVMIKLMESGTLVNAVIGITLGCLLLVGIPLVLLINKLE